MKKEFCIAMLTLVLLSCNEAKESTVQKSPRRNERSVGAQIPLDVGYRWINNFNRTSTGGRTSNSYSLNADSLANAIGNVDDRVGIALHHAVDESGDYHLFLFAIDEDGALFKNKIFDVSNGEIVDQVTAKLWADKYTSQYTVSPWYHFIGSDIISEILSNSAFDHVDIVRGLNDDHEEQILLFVYNTRVGSGGRTQTEVLVFDKANPCPPCSV